MIVALLRVSALATCLVFAVLIALDSGLHTEQAARGIVSFELAGSRAADVLAGWSEAQRRDALLLQGLDYLFIVAYATLLATASLALAARLDERAPRLRRLGRAAAWGAVLAGAADVVENVPLILMLRSGVASPTGAAIAQASALLKFGLLLAVVAYLVCARAVARLR